MIKTANKTMQIIMSGLTRITGKEWALLKMADGKIMLRVGTEVSVNMEGATVVLAHSHPEVKYFDLRLSGDDLKIMYNQLGQSETILIPGKGSRYIGITVDLVESYLQTIGL